MVDFASLKKTSSLEFQEKLAKAAQAVSSTSESTSYSEDHFWKPTLDKSSNGMATIRFLPASPQDGDDALPWVKYFNHGFQGPQGQWFIENCLTSKGQDCGCCSYNSVLWNSGIEANKDVARSQKRKLNYIANIYVVSDPGNPDNNGKVFLYRFGKKIFDKISELMTPAFADETPVNPFDLWKGANFKLKVRKVEGYINYDKSEFESPSPLSKNDDQLEKIWKSEYFLGNPEYEFNKFKSHEDIQKRLNLVLGIAETSQPAAQTTVQKIKSDVKSGKVDLPWRTEEEEVELLERVSSSKKPVSVEEDDDLAYFEKLIDA